MACGANSAVALRGSPQVRLAPQDDGRTRLRRLPPCGKDRAVSGLIARLPPAQCCRSSVVEHPLGKGEVVSSILTGSTRNARQIRASDTPPKFRPATRDATKHEHDVS